MAKVIDQVVTENYSLYNGDSCQILPGIPDESVGLTVYSPPFAELYQFSSSDEDLSNCDSYETFLEHFSFIVKQINRVTIPGRLSAIHCMELKQGTWACRDFPGDIVRLYEKEGWSYCGRIHVWKEPFKVRLKTYLRSLMHKTLIEDSTNSYPAGPDYIILMRKGGVSSQPVTHPEMFQDYSGASDPKEREELGLLPIPNEYLAYKGRTDVPAIEHRWSHWVWRQYASSVWMDIRLRRLLPDENSKEHPEERHICPLQLDVIERLVQLYSNPGDVVLSPFGGIGSEPFTAVKLGRRAIAIELKKSYYNKMVRNVEMALHRSYDDDLDLFAANQTEEIGT